MITATLWSLLNVFEEAGNTPRCVASIEQAFADRAEVRHVFIDGAYAGFPCERRLSEDGTMEFAIDHGHLLLRPDVDECEKRTAGLRYIDSQAKDGDWVLYLDADEELSEVHAWPQRTGVLSFTRDSDGKTYDRCRLYRWEPGLYFAERHYRLFDFKGELVAGLKDGTDCDRVGSGVHHDLSHSPEREALKRSYYPVLTAAERASA